MKIVKNMNRYKSLSYHIKIFSILVLVLSAPYISASSQLKVSYQKAVGEDWMAVSVLFGNRSNPEQRTEEWSTPKNSINGYKSYIPLHSRYSLLYVSEFAYFFVDGDPPKKINFSDGRYSLSSLDIPVSTLEKTRRTSREELAVLDRVSSDIRKKLVKEPNLSVEWRRLNVPHCGDVKFVIRTDESGAWIPNEIVFEKHGRISVPYYTVEDVSCNANGRITLKLAYYIATGGIRSTDDEWDYNQSIAIIDTGIAAVE